MRKVAIRLQHLLDLMVRFKVSPEIRKILYEYNTTEKFSESDGGYIDPKSASVEHLQLAHIAAVMKAKGKLSEEMQYSLGSMLKTTCLYLEPPVKPNSVRSFIGQADLRIPSIAQEWRCFVNDLNSKSTTTWSPTFNPRPKCLSSPTTTTMLQTPKS